MCWVIVFEITTSHLTPPCLVSQAPGKIHGGHVTRNNLRSRVVGGYCWMVCNLLRDSIMGNTCGITVILLTIQNGTLSATVEG